MRHSTKPFGPALAGISVLVAGLFVVAPAGGSAAGTEPPPPEAPTEAPTEVPSGAPTEASAGGPGDGAVESAFPVTVEHLWGETTIDEAPQRVVSLGVTDSDIALALGVTPIALVGFQFFESGLGPWAMPLIDGDAPEVLSEAEPNIEYIASLDPDLILAVSSGFEENVYDRLAEIAPTVVRPVGTNAYQVPRAASTELIAAALGQPERGAELAAEADAAYDTAVAEHPEFAGRTGVVVLPYDGRYGVFTPLDSRGQAMAQLGFELPPALAELASDESFFIEISQEQAGLLDADVIVMLADEGEQREFVDNDAVLQALPAVVDGRMIIPDTDTRGAITYNTVLSVPYVIEHLVPQIADALA